MRKETTWVTAMIPPPCSRALIDQMKIERSESLKEWMDKRNPRSDRLFSMAHSKESRLFRMAQEKTGIHIILKTLRAWFCCEMARLGVQDRQVDAFGGRTPKSVLSRHYTQRARNIIRNIVNNG